MSQKIKEQADMATWNAIRDDVLNSRLAEGDMSVAELVDALARKHPFPQQTIADGVMEGARQGQLAVEGDRVSLKFGGHQA